MASVGELSSEVEEDKKREARLLSVKIADEVVQRGVAKAGVRGPGDAG